MPVPPGHLPLPKGEVTHSDVKKVHIASFILGKSYSLCKSTKGQSQPGILHLPECSISKVNNPFYLHYLHSLPHCPHCSQVLLKSRNSILFKVFTFEHTNENVRHGHSI